MREMVRPVRGLCRMTGMPNSFLSLISTCFSEIGSDKYTHHTGSDTRVISPGKKDPPIDQSQFIGNCAIDAGKNIIEVGMHGIN